MQRDVSSSKVLKQWGVGVSYYAKETWLGLIVFQAGRQCYHVSVNITGASPAYVEALVERLNIHINNLLYELGRIPR